MCCTMRCALSRIVLSLWTLWVPTRKWQHGSILTDGQIAIRVPQCWQQHVHSDCIYSHRGEIGSSTNESGTFFFLAYNRLQIKNLKTKYYHKTDASSSFGNHRIDALKTERWWRGAHTRASPSLSPSLFFFPIIVGPLSSEQMQLIFIFKNR